MYSQSCVADEDRTKIKYCAAGVDSGIDLCCRGVWTKV
jgi:hypothetical protein